MTHLAALLTSSLDSLIPAMIQLSARSAIELVFLLSAVALGARAWTCHKRALQRERDRAAKTVESQTLQLVDTELSAEEANRLKSEFLAEMSCEIRTQLTSALGTLDLVLASSLTREQREYLVMSKRAADSLLTLLDDTLEMSRLEARKADLEHVDFRLRDCLQSVAEKAGRGARIEIAPDVPERIMGDPYRLRQALQKIVEHTRNSFAERAVLIGVRLEREPDESNQSGGRWLSLLFTVRHCRFGNLRKTSQDFLTRVEQSIGSAARTYGGKAIGLELCGHIIKLMGGRIWLDTEASGEQRFFFTVQVEMPTVIQHEAAPAALALVTPRKETPECPRILIVEDNPINQLVVKRILQKHGFETIVADDGPAALALLESTAADLVLMDVNMPEMDGFEVTQRIRERERETGAHVPIVAVTANALPGDRKKCLVAGMDDYISKPIQSKQLLHCVDTLLNRAAEPDAEFNSVAQPGA